jgi:hypothetical protein
MKGTAYASYGVGLNHSRLVSAARCRDFELLPSGIWSSKEILDFQSKNEVISFHYENKKSI